MKNIFSNLTSYNVDDDESRDSFFFSEEEEEEEESKEEAEESGDSDDSSGKEDDNEEGKETEEEEQDDKNDSTEDKNKKFNFDDIEVETRSKEDKNIDDKDKEEEDVDPEDEKTIGKIVDKRLNPIQERIQRQNDELEVNDYLMDNPDLKAYKPVMLKYLSHPAYKNIPVANIAAIVASKDLMKLGAKKEREAQSKANATKDNSKPFRKSGTSKIDWSTASKEEFDDYHAKVLGQK